MVNKLLLVLVIINIFFFSSCKKEINPLDYKGKVIKEIKKEVVFTEDGSEVNLGGDSINRLFYIIRHAEKDTHKIDPPLNEEGVKRAARLTNIMRRTFLDAVYTTLTQRTMQTVDSITQYKGLSNTIYVRENLKEKMQELANSEDKKKVLIVGHTNTIPPVANFLYGQNYFNKQIDENDYSNFIIIVERKSGKKQIFEFKY